MDHCPNCHSNSWQLSESRLGRINSSITIWAQVTECKVCGYHFMTDQQVESADQQLLAVENTYS